VSKIKKITIKDFKLKNEIEYSEIVISYQIFGKPIGSAPLVLVNHALTGNSQVIGRNGWWNELVGENKTIDTNKYAVLAFNIPGNAFQDDKNIIVNYNDFITYDIAELFWKAIDFFKVNKIFAVIGGSLGGAIAWEMAAIRPTAIKHLIPIATSWKSSDWLIANVLIQDLILNNSKNPIQDARIHAMLLYRTPESLKEKFNTTYQSEDLFQVESWLLYHGEKLKDRFQLSAYKLMNHLLKTTNVLREKSVEKLAKEITSTIHLVAIDADCFFTASEIRMCFSALKKYKKNVLYNQIQSVHGHDAFLIEYRQLNKILKPIFK
jgi:homoserine O-acetyltransferase